jgi:menaquinone-dependent protoporphyrinogen IX oxidase
MKVLVAYASRHGSTAGIAERIAARLSEGGLQAEARPVAEVHALPAGDFRDWEAIDAWADEIVAGLKSSGGPAAGVQAG